MLPIESVIPVMRAALCERGVAVVQAPPGAGKTTRVPLALLNEDWLGGRKIVMLEPRRLAARAAATYMATLLGEQVGETVGYRVRMDTRIGSRTRIEVVTEGVLTRLVRDDPTLDGAGLIIFDEFHERSVHADLGLALTLETRSVVRDDLRVLVMSATLDGSAVASLLGDGASAAPVVTSQGRLFPVTTRYLPRRPERPLDVAVATAVRRALVEDGGDILVFLPGAGEIRQVAARLADVADGDEVYVAPLFGNLSQDAQDRAIAPSEKGRRKVVLATSIAETSLTIEGVRVVIDSGLMRVPRFSPRSGMTRLETVRVTRAAADQRRGRAGRVAPGVCYRLWPETEDQHLTERGRPEILDADLAPLALELTASGIRDAAALRWLDPPPAAALAQARELLGQLGAIDDHGRITEHGRRMADVALHPRLAHMVVAASAIGLGAPACDIAAIVSERDVFRGDGGDTVDPDLRLRLDVLRNAKQSGPASMRGAGATIDRGAVQRVATIARDLRREIRAPSRRVDDGHEAGLLLALAYPDRIAQRRSARGRDASAPARYLLRNGAGAFLPRSDALTMEEYLAVGDIGGRGTEARIHLAAPLTLEEIERHFGDQIVREEVVAWDDAAGIVRARARQRLGALILRDTSSTTADPAAVAAALLEAVARNALRDLPWTEPARQLQQRLRFMHHLDPSWPDVSDEALAARLESWLGPHVRGMSRRDDLRRLDLPSILLDLLDWEQRRALNRDAPSEVVVPSGSRIAIDYSDPAAPILAVRLQEIFGLEATPRIGGGRVPLTVHLLSPARRPVQVTTDLAGFWRSSYFDVRKEMKGRYPKHDWPENPLTATAKRRR